MESLKLYKKANNFQSRYELKEALECYEMLMRDYPESLYAEQAESDIEKVKELISVGSLDSQFSLNSKRLSIFAFTIFFGGLFHFFTNGMDYEKFGPYVLAGLINTLLAIIMGCLGIWRTSKYSHFLKGKEKAIFGVKLGSVLLVANVLATIIIMVKAYN